MTMALGLFGGLTLLYLVRSAMVGLAPSAPARSSRFCSSAELAEVQKLIFAVGVGL